MSIGASFDNRPPCGLRRLGFRCLYTRLTPSTTRRFLSDSTRMTRRARPFSANSPVITSTRSSLRIRMVVIPSFPQRSAGFIPAVNDRRGKPGGSWWSFSHDLGGQADDFQEAAVAQLAGHGPEDARAARVLFVVDQHHGVAVEA